MLILGIPGAASSATADLAASMACEIAALATAGDEGLEVRSGHVDGPPEESLDRALAGLPENPHPETPSGVLVPLLAAPHPHVEDALHHAASTAGVSLCVSGPLGPHPLIAGVLHTRLADSGLARPDRARELNVTTEADGVVVAASGSTGMQAAEVTSVLLASRLAVPAVPAALDGETGIDDAAARLREAGATQLSIAPCFIGPEADARRLDEAARSIGGRRSAPLGAHPDIAKLAMQCYGAALDESVAGAETAVPRQ